MGAATAQLFLEVLVPGIFSLPLVYYSDRSMAAMAYALGAILSGMHRTILIMKQSEMFSSEKA